MKILSSILLTTLLVSSHSFAQSAFAQSSNSTTVSKKIDDFGLRDKLLPVALRSKLNLNEKQLGVVNKLDSSTKKLLDKLAKEGKFLTHSHGDGEECQACAHAEKVRATYRGYFAKLGEVLTEPQKKQLKSLTQATTSNK